MFNVVAQEDYQKGAREIEVVFQGGLNPGFKTDDYFTFTYAGVAYPCKLLDPMIGDRQKANKDAAAARLNKPVPTTPSAPLTATTPVVPNPNAPGPIVPPTAGATVVPNPNAPGPIVPPTAGATVPPKVDPNLSEADKAKAAADKVKADAAAKVKTDASEKTRLDELKKTETEDFNKQAAAFKQLKEHPPEVAPGTPKKTVTVRASTSGMSPSLTHTDAPTGTQKFATLSINVILMLTLPLNDFMKKNTVVDLRTKV